MNSKQLLFLSLISTQLLGNGHFDPQIGYNAQKGVTARVYVNHSTEDNSLTSTQKIANNYVNFLIPSAEDAVEMIFEEESETLKKALVAKIVSDPNKEIFKTKFVTITKDDVIRTAGTFIKKFVEVASKKRELSASVLNKSAKKSAKEVASDIVIGFAYNKITQVLAEQAGKRGLSLPEAVKKQVFLCTVAKHVAAKTLLFGLCMTYGAVGNAIASK